LNLKKYLERRIRGWLPKEPNLPRDRIKTTDVKTKIPKPRWWNAVWIGTVLAIIASGIIFYFTFHTTLERLILEFFLIFLCVGIAYYIRIKPSIRINKIVYVLLGISPFGFSLSVGYAFFIGRYVTGWLMGWFNIIVTVGILITGGLIGDWIGRRRNYQLPLSL
jgi:hypothetical protein